MAKISVTMPAGDYWLGDPCYSVPKNLWSQWLEDAGNENGARLLVAPVPGTKLLAVGLPTAHGDGVYMAEHLNGDEWDFGVDSGLIGLVPVAASTHPQGGKRSDPVLLTLSEETVVYAVDGKLHFGPWVVDTDPDYEESCTRCGGQYCDCDQYYYCDECDKAEYECQCWNFDEE